VPWSSAVCCFMSRTRSILAAAPAALGRAAPRLAALTPAERRLLLQAPVVLPAVALALRWGGLTRVQQRLLRPGAGVQAPGSSAERRAAAERLAWCVQVASAYGPWPANCLQRSVVLCWFLHRRGLTGELRMGVRQDEDGSLDFHSWVEHDGFVLNDTRDVRERYAAFSTAGTPVTT
jgi:hypothetical protein